MKYPPIEIELKKDAIELFFIRDYGRQWFYEIPAPRTKDGVEWWNKHLKEKMWYTPEIKEKILKAMNDFLKSN